MSKKLNTVFFICYNRIVVFFIFEGIMSIKKYVFTIISVFMLLFSGPVFAKEANIVSIGSTECTALTDTCLPDGIQNR